MNLNRAFINGAGTESALTGITHRIAEFVRQCIWPKVDVVIDLHSGGNVMRFDLRQTAIAPSSPRRALLQSSPIGH